MNQIGKKVNLLVKSGICSSNMSDEVCKIVKVIPFSAELNDYCGHYIVRKPDGTEVEIRECECVFSPDNTKPFDLMVHNFLNDNGVWADVYSAIGEDCDKAVKVSISWGDWKHDHLWATVLMRYIGYEQVSEEVTEEDGSDCYSADHVFVKII